MNTMPRPGINLLSEEIQRDPSSTYRRMLRDYPVCQLEPEGIVAICRYDDVRYALKRADIFSSKAVLKLYQPEWLSEAGKRDYSIFSQDPPEHTKNRALVNKAFITKVINRLVSFMGDIARTQVSSIGSGQEIDFIEFARHYSYQVSSKITGTEGFQSYEEFKEWISLSEAISLSRPSDEFIEALEAAQVTQTNLLLSVIADRRANTRDDLVSELIESELDGMRLDDRMLSSLLELLVSAGVDTVAYTLAHCVMLLSTDAELCNVLQGDYSLIPSFIEELLRYDPPTHQLLRKTTTDCEVSDIKIPSGSLVLLMIGAANRDRGHFDEPDRFILNRKNSREHLAFGVGPHACIGAALARKEVEILVRHLLECFSHISVPSSDQLQWVASINSRAPKRLPVVFT